MKINKLFVCATVACASLIGNPLIAQVRIGQQSNPVNGAVLDLKADAADAYYGGLRLPRIKITDKSLIPAKTAGNPNGFTAFSTDEDTNLALVGVIVYNVGGEGAIPAGAYYWSGTEWQGVVSSSSESGGVVVIPSDPVYAQRGFGQFISGRRCVTLGDIESGELNNKENGILNAGRTYTFKAWEPAIDFRFIIQDAEGLLVSVTEPNKTSLAINETASTTLTFRTDLENAEAVRSVSVYASYRKEINGTEFVVPMVVSIRDYGRSCCYAKINATETREFMCGNLGADDSQDWNKAGDGYFYQWGNPRPAGDNARTFGVWGHIENYEPRYTWPQDGSKGITDPCPTGWRVPTQAEWTGVINNNTYRQVATEVGAYLGEYLFLPFAGYRTASNNGNLTDHNNYGYYWTQTPHGNANAIALRINRSTQFADFPNYSRAYGASIRCIQE